MVLQLFYFVTIVCGVSAVAVVDVGGGVAAGVAEATASIAVFYFEFA